MRRPEHAGESAPAEPVDAEPESSGPNLVLIYALLALGFVVALGCAALIVLPFYHRR